MQRGFVLMVCLALLGGVGRAWAEPGQVHHVVIVWLKDPGSSAARGRYLEVSQRLAALPGVVSYRLASPVPAASRAPVDSSYDLAVTAVFKDKKAWEEYNANPLHRKTIDELHPLVQKVVVYDFIE